MTDKRAVKIVRLHKKAIRFITTFGKFFITGACGPEWALRVSRRITLAAAHPSLPGNAGAFVFTALRSFIIDKRQSGIAAQSCVVRCRRRRRLCALLRLQGPIARVVAALHRVAGEAASPA